MVEDRVRFCKNSNKTDCIQEDHIELVYTKCCALWLKEKGRKRKANSTSRSLYLVRNNLVSIVGCVKIAFSCLQV